MSVYIYICKYLYIDHALYIYIYIYIYIYPFNLGLLPTYIVFCTFIIYFGIPDLRRVTFWSLKAIYV